MTVASLAHVGVARGATPIPQFSADRVAVAGVPDRYDALRAALAQRQSRIGAQLYVCIVARSDPRNRDGVEYASSAIPYVDKVFEAWGPEIDVQRGIVIVLALENRGVAVKPGSEWTLLGFERRAVTDVIDGSRFKPLARAGDYGGAVLALITAIEDDIARRRTELAQARERAAALIESQRLQLGATTTRLDTAPFDDPDLRQDIAALVARIAAGSAALAGGEASEAVRALSALRYDLNALDRRLDRAIAEDRFRHVTLPRIVAGVLLALLALAALLLFRRGRRLRARARAAIGAFDVQVAQAAQHLDALVDDHGLLFGGGDLASHFAGETLERVRQAADKVDELLLRFAAAERVITEARAALARSRNPLATAGSLDALGSLGDRLVDVGTEELRERRLLVPRERTLTVPANALLASMDAIYAEVCREAEAIEQTVREVADGLRSAAERHAQTLAALGDLTASGLRCDVLESRHAALDARLAQIDAASRRDPVGQLGPAAELADEIAELAESASRAQRLLALTSGEIGPHAAQQSERIGKLRQEGLRLAEPGFDPEAMLAAARAGASDARTAAERGDPRGGLTHAERARDLVLEVGRLIDATLEVRAELGARSERARARSLQLRGRLPERRERLDALRAEHADRALLPALDNIQEAEAAFTLADRAIDDAERAGSATEQRYLAARELMRRAAGAFDAIDGLYAEIDGKGEALAEARRAAESDLAAGGADYAEVCAIRASEPSVAAASCLAGTDGLGSELDAAKAAHGGARPDWPDLSENAAELRSRAAELLAAAREQLEAHRAFVQEYPQAIDLCEVVARLLAESEDDRPPANEAHAEAVRRRGEIERALAQPERGLDWVSLRSDARAFRDLLQRARELARADLGAAALARRLVARADGDVHDARGYYGMGITADVSSADAALADARRALHAREYELAQQRATAASAAAAGARAHAEEVARLKRSAARRQSPAYSTGTSSSYTWGSSSASSFGGSSSFGSAGGGFGSSSGGGGSSFGSSSGGASHGSSSGGSSW